MLISKWIFDWFEYDGRQPISCIQMCWVPHEGQRYKTCKILFTLYNVACCTTVKEYFSAPLVYMPVRKRLTLIKFFVDSRSNQILSEQSAGNFALQISTKSFTAASSIDEERQLVGSLFRTKLIHFSNESVPLFSQNLTKFKNLI